MARRLRPFLLSVVISLSCRFVLGGVRVRVSRLRFDAGLSPPTDRWAEDHEAQDLEQKLGPGLSRIGRGVVLGGHLDHVSADEVHPGETPDESLRLPGR